MGIAVVGTVFVDIKGFPYDVYNPTGRNAGTVEIVHGGVGRNVAEDIANVELRPTFVSMVDDTANGTEVIEKLKKHKMMLKEKSNQLLLLIKRKKMKLMFVDLIDHLKI